MNPNLKLEPVHLLTDQHDKELWETLELEENLPLEIEVSKHKKIYIFRCGYSQCGKLLLIKNFCKNGRHTTYTNTMNRKAYCDTSCRSKAYYERSKRTKGLRDSTLTIDLTAMS